jgi:hypothetical protein
VALNINSEEFENDKMGGAKRRPFLMPGFPRQKDFNVPMTLVFTQWSQSTYVRHRLSLFSFQNYIEPR